MKLILISGGSASGKTTFAKKLQEKLEGSLLLSQDNYHLDVSHLKLEDFSTYNFDKPSSINLDLMVENINTLWNDGEVHIPYYDFETSKVHHEHIKLKIPKVLIVEGLFSMHIEKLRYLSHMNLFIDIDSDVRLARRILRDTKERGCSVPNVISRYMEFVKPGHDEFIQPQINYACHVIEEHNFDDKIKEISILINELDLQDFSNFGV